MRRRGLFILLIVVIILGMFPVSVFAKDNKGSLSNFSHSKAFSADKFSDIDKGDWFYDNIKSAYQLGLMVGSSETAFKPGKNITIAETIAVASRIHAIYHENNKAFSNGNPWYQTYVDYANRNNIISVEFDDYNKPANREEFAVILAASLPKDELEVMNNLPDDGVPDVKSDDSYGHAVYALYRAGVLVGNDAKGTFAPKSNIKRSEVAAIISRMVDTSLRQSVGHRIIFDSGTNRTAQNVFEGKNAIEPSRPVKNGYSFNGWYTALSGGTEFDFTTQITRDITLYAHWSPFRSESNQRDKYKPSSTALFTVTFNSNGGSEISSQSVARNQTAIMPAPPIRENYTFVGWYSDSDLSYKFDFDSSITSDITLYARWISSSDNLLDDIIDYGDVIEMMSMEKVDVIFGEDGSIRTIDGKFTDRKIRNEDDAAETIESASSLFAGTENAFDVNTSEIIMQSVEGGHGLINETFFRYSPVVNDIPVLGSQIVISTDEDGNSTGLFSTYNDSILKVDTSTSITSDSAVSIAIDALLDSELVQEAVTKCLQEYTSVTEDYLKQVLRNVLVSHAYAPLVIYAVDTNETPALVYAVKLSNTDYGNTESVESADSGLSVPIGSDSPVEPNEAEDDVFGNVDLLIDDTYYIYANGNNAGSICSVVSNNKGCSSVYLATPDLKGIIKHYIAQEENGIYRMVDSSRNMETYKAKVTLQFKPDFISFSNPWWKIYSLPGDIVKGHIPLFGSEVSMNKSAVSAHVNIGKAYDYYLNILNRQSFDGKGAKIITTVGYGDDKNAFWNNKQFVFKKGNYEAALDVVAHEFTHAVIGSIISNGGLEYSNESGALEESYADIMGCLIEGKSGNDKWLLAEDSNSAQRNFMSPSKYNQPQHYSDRYIGKDDNGGVHKNSGIFNHAAYKMMTDSRTSNISEELWANVFYRSLYRLARDSRFLDGRGAIIASAKMFGFSKDQQQAIKDAFDAVGITEPESTRIVLRWGPTPSDLDSHLVGPGINGGRFWTSYKQPDYYADGTYNGSSTRKNAVNLDYDDTTSYGPEVTTIYTLTPGEYYFFVHDYSNRGLGMSTEMARSGATVNVYKGSSAVPMAGGSFAIDRASRGTYWNVFRLIIEEDRSTVIEPINTYGIKKEVY